MLWQFTSNISDSSVSEYLITDTSNSGADNYSTTNNFNSGVGKNS